MKEQQIDEQLWSYIDGSASASEKVFVEKMLETQEVWKTKYNKQLELHQLLTKKTELEQPSLRFTKNVMDGIAGLQPKTATITYINKNIIRSIAAFFIITISTLLIYSFTQINWASTVDSSKLLPFNSRGLQLPDFKIMKVFNSTVLYSIMMVTAVLSLMLFDSFLRRKKSAI